MNTQKFFCFIISFAGLVLVVLLALHPQPTSASTTWYVTPGGDDNDDCKSQGTACGSIQGTLNKPGFLDGDTIMVATGIYTGTSSQVLLIDKSANIFGGWDNTFSIQDNVSIIDGENTRRGILVNSNTTSSIDHFTIQRGTSIDGGGIFNNGTLRLDNSSVVSNTVSDEGGGVFIQSGGILTLNKSTIGYNQSNSGGGIFSIKGTLNINNSTLHNNFANGGGGINNLSGSVSLNSSTISGNAVGTMAGGGIRNEGGTVILQNTIIAENTGNSGPDCNGDLDSSGYNLIGDISGCTFSSGTGDLLNTNPGLFPVPLGSPSYYALLSNSPAIDTGNPGGCQDHQGSLLTSDQRGIGRVGRCDIGSYEYDPVYDPITSLFLPAITRNYCADFFDDFSNPNSGWYIFDNGDIKWSYQGGEYEIRLRNSDWWGGVSAPVCDYVSYEVEADMRLISGTSEAYGLIFEREDWEHFYLFLVHPSTQHYSLWGHDPTWWNLVDWTYSPHIKNSPGIYNHLEVEREGSQIKLSVNDQFLTSVHDMTYSSSSREVGLYAQSVYDAPVVARFDNFSVKSLSAEGSPSLDAESPVSIEESPGLSSGDRLPFPVPNFDR